ncbi:hypothetical protein CVT30_00330 [Streptomyces sp. AMCC400023]|nr:hypothetical protein CVT30_00330 [Streptomyces sp. AMCC400023]
MHEHACVRCRFLRVDPAQLGRLVAALEESLQHLRRRREEAGHLRADHVELLGRAATTRTSTD